MPDPPHEATEEREGALPSLTLIFTLDGAENVPWEAADLLLDHAEAAIQAIEDEDQRFHILKAFTFYAGADYQSQAEKIDALKTALTRARQQVESAGRVVEAARELIRTRYDSSLNYRETFGWPEYERLDEAVSALDTPDPGTPEEAR